MFDENEDQPAERPLDPADRAKDKFDEFRMHAEFCAVFEGTRKFDAEIYPGLDIDLARDLQRSIAKLEKSRVAETPVIDPAQSAEALRVLKFYESNDLSTNNYHLHRRPGEVMIARWLEGELVDAFYTRLQAHFDAALNQFREEERQQKAWKQDKNTLAYLDALDKIDVKMSDRYLRDQIKQHKLFVLSTQTADELDILHLTYFVMGVPPAQIVGAASAPAGDQPTEQDRAWFFKLFSLRGMEEDVERMCFFAYLQKAEGTFDL